MNALVDAKLVCSIVSIPVTRRSIITDRASNSVPRGLIQGLCNIRVEFLCLCVCVCV